MANGYRVVAELSCCLLQFESSLFQKREEGEILTEFCLLELTWSVRERGSGKQKVNGRTFGDAVRVLFIILARSSLSLLSPSLSIL